MFNFQNSVTNIYYLIGRILSLVIKPLILTLLLYFSNQSLSNDLSAIYLVSMISLVLSSFSTHRNYYIKFSENRSEEIIKNEESFYLSSLPIIFFFSIIVCYFVNKYFSFKETILLPSIFFLLADKVYDELQRKLILIKDYEFWGKLNIGRFIINFFCFSLIFFTNKNNLLIYALFNLLLFLTYVTLIFKINFNILLYYIFKKSDTYFKIILKILKLKKFLIGSILASSFSYCDRIITADLNFQLLSHITIVAMIFSFLPTFVNIFFISRYVKEFASNKIKLNDIFYSKYFWYPLIIFSMLGWVAVLAYFNFFSVNNNISFFAILLIFLNQLIISITIVMTTMKYWKKSNIEIIIIDSFFWIIFFLVINFFSVQLKNLDIAFLILNLLFLVRLIIYIFRLRN